jgi:hypothetical protein
LYRQEWLRFFFFFSFCLVLIGYRIYRKKHKYSFYLKK